MFKLEKVKITSVKPAEYNPKDRVKNIERLAKSIEKFGLIYPIILDKDNNLIDGHRRWTACKLLKWEEIPALVSSGEEHRDELYAEVNVTQKAMTGRNALYVWYHNPKAVSPMVAIRYNNMQEIIGRKLVKQMVDQQVSPSAFRRARQLAEYCGWEEDKVAACLIWIMENGYSRNMEAAMINHTIRPDMIRVCVEKAKPLKLSFKVG